MARIVLHRIQVKRESDQVALRFTRKILREIQFQARLKLFSGPYTTGALARSIQVQGPFIEARRTSGSVGSDLDYAASVEKGARPHEILPRGVRLKFYWRRVGRVVSLPFVDHPGQRGKGYLRRAAEEVGRRHNMIVLIYDV